MEDDFYEPLSSAASIAQSSGPITAMWSYILSAPLIFIGTLLLALPLLFIVLQPNGDTSEEPGGGQEKTVWMVPYWPIVGHSLQFLHDPSKLMNEARDRSAHSVFSLKLGLTTHNIISHPALAASVMQQEESALQPHPTAWNITQRFFGVPKRSKPKYSLIWDQLQSTLKYLIEEPHLINILKSTMHNLEGNIPQMISFMDSEIDQHPWERSANASFISNLEMELNLMSLMRDILGTASTSAIFGRGLLEKFPNILHDLYDMDAGMPYLLTGLPAWTPWPSVSRAHLARRRVLESLDEFQEALDASVDGKHVDYSWGDLDDVSEFILKRHAIYKENGLGITERADISILWGLAVKADLVAYWQLLHILASPDLADRLRSEIAPYVQVTKPASIGSFAEAPKLAISHEGLFKKCPLLRATYFEAMRLSARPSSTRRVATDVTISGDASATDSPSYVLRKGEYVTASHNLHMRDPKYFEDPDSFSPERFLVQAEDGTVSADMRTIKPYGDGPAMCKGRVLAERECLALVAGILVCWDIEPADKKSGWVIPKQMKSSTVCRPVHDTRVRIKPRAFKWDN